MNYASWGTVSSESDINLVVEVKNILKHKCLLEFNKLTNQVKISGFEHSFKDSINIEGYLVRSFSDGTTFYIKNENIILKTKSLKTDYMQTLKTDAESENPIFNIGIFNAATLDIETVLQNGKHVPYLFSFYDGVNKYSFFEKEPTNLFKTMLLSKYRGRTVYAHNLSRFDIVFLFKHLAKLQNKGYKVNILKKDDKIISITIVKGKNTCITLKDSLLLLPSSLDKLTKNFNLETGKLVEPVFVGTGMNKFKSDNLDHYTKDIERIEDLAVWKTKIQAYCEQDCVALYDVLHKFHHLIKVKWNLDITKYSTIPSLAFAIYRMHYMPENTVPLTKGAVFNFIKQGYTGGSTEMYKPNAIGKELYCYDVNSLYPAVMSQNMYPTGQIFQYEGDITILDKYWIGEVEVSTKSDLYQPYLQIHHKTPSGWRTVAPNGKFNMVINSCEYSNAVKDYNINVNKGYLFETKTNIFKDYVWDMYQLRQQYTKSEPMNFIAKLLLNSLYGRFGMQPQLHSHIFGNFKEIQELCRKYEILDYIELDKDLFFVSYQSSDNKNLDSSLPKSNSTGVSVSIASAVTAYARVYMSTFKNNPGYNLYYTDTDSIFIDKELDPRLVNSNLGNMKLEYKFTDSIFLAPKVYAGMTDDNLKICKVKGFTGANELTLEDFTKLLYKNSHFSLNHTKWFRNLFNSTITMKETPYNLVQTDNKRELIFDSNGRAFDTKALKIIS